MNNKLQVQLLGSILLVGWLGLTACARLAAPSTKQVAPSALDFVVDRLYSDISHAQDIAQRKPDMPSPNEPITYEYGTDAHHQAYRFANLRAFRLDIKHRMDSLRLAGRVLSYDTIAGEAGPTGKMVVD
jgi:hypothetical protein